MVVVSAKPKANDAVSPPARLEFEEPVAPVATEDPPSRLSAAPAIQPVAGTPLVVQSRRSNADLSTAEGAVRELDEAPSLGASRLRRAGRSVVGSDGTTS